MGLTCIVSWLVLDVCLRKWAPTTPRPDTVAFSIGRLAQHVVYVAFWVRWLYYSLIGASFLCIPIGWWLRRR